MKETMYYIIRKNGIHIAESYVFQTAKKKFNKMIKEDEYHGNQYELVEIFQDEKILNQRET